MTQANGTRRWQDILAWLSFPGTMVVYIAAAVYCIEHKLQPAMWVPLLAATHFFVLVALEQIIPRNRAYNLFKDRQSVNDLVFNTLNGAIRPLFAAMLAVLVAKLAAARDLSELSTLWPTQWPFWLQCTLGIFTAALMDYFYHRGVHTVPRLWWFHSLHHSATQMHVLKGGRIHFIDEMIHDLSVPLPFLLFGAPVEVVLFTSMWGVYTGNLSHANVDQRFPSWAHYILPTVHLHNLHHSIERRFQDSNYSGTLPFWDILFGTYNHPKACAQDTANIELGMHDKYVPGHLLKQFYLPLLWQMKPPAEVYDNREKRRLRPPIAN
jgi:sterol desaturase/sphingolipid hydroxylase (fatty acid hydroxylase superfamily)